MIADRERYRMRAIDRAELSDGGLDVLVDSSLRDVEDLADLPGGFPSRHPPIPPFREGSTVFVWRGVDGSMQRARLRGRRATRQAPTWLPTESRCYARGMVQYTAPHYLRYCAS